MYRIIGGDGNEYGPFSAEVLRQYIAEGRADAQTRVLTEGASEWKKLADLPEFAPDVAAPTAPTAPTAPSPSGAPRVIAPTASAPPSTRVNPLAVAGFCLGLASVTFGLCCSGLPFNLAGLICSGIALHQIRSRPGQEQGWGLAIAGVILSVLGLLATGVAVLFNLVGRHPHWMHQFKL